MLKSDVPIKLSKDDILGRKSFSEQLAKTIIDYNHHESINIGLYGEWGSGKTSVMNMVEENLYSLTKLEEQKPVILRFNPWMFTDSNQLITQFFNQLSNVFKLHDGKKMQRIGENLQLFGNAIELASVVPIIGPISIIASKVAKKFGKKIFSEGNKRSSDLQAIKDSLVKELGHSQSKVIIFIDDIDRLSNTEIRAVFKLIKSIADFPNTIYLLAFDYNIVVTALGEVQNNNGESYLEKIIQIPFHLPHINETKLAQLFLSELESTLNNIPERMFDIKDWSTLFNYGIKPNLESMRDLVRLNNTINLKYSFLQNEANIVDLLGITTLQVFAPKIYSSLSFYKDLLCGPFSTFSSTSYSSIESQKDDIKKICDNLIADLPDKDRTSTLAILTILFPKINEVYKKQSFYYTNSNRSGCISDKNFFDRYFSLTLDEGLSIVQVDSLMFSAHEDDLIDIIKDINLKNNANLLLEYINTTFTELKGKNDTNERLCKVLNSILRTWHSLNDTDKDKFFSFSFDLRLRQLVGNFLQIYSNSIERKECIISFFEDKYITNGIKANILLMLGDEHGRYLDDTEKKEITNCQITWEHLLSIENVLFEKIRYSDFSELINDKYFLFVTILLEKSENEDMRAFFENTISKLKEDGLSTAKFISSMTIHGKVSGDLVYDTWKFDYEYMSKYFNIERTICLMEKFVKKVDFLKLSLEQREDIIVFIAHGKFCDSSKNRNMTKNSIYKYAEENNIILDK